MTYKILLAVAFCISTSIRAFAMQEDDNYIGDSSCPVYTEGGQLALAYAHGGGRPVSSWIAAQISGARNVSRNMEFWNTATFVCYLNLENPSAHYDIESILFPSDREMSFRKKEGEVVMSFGELSGSLHNDSSRRSSNYLSEQALKDLDSYINSFNRIGNALGELRSGFNQDAQSNRLLRLFLITGMKGSKL